MVNLRHICCGLSIRDSITTAPGDLMIILGIVLLLIGYFAGIPILTTLGVILLVVGVVLFLLGSTGRAVGGRAHYW
jgi:membrane-bound ClpP family serine protease